MKKILITGSEGFVGKYLCEEFLSKGYQVIGVDNFSKYGVVSNDHVRHPNFELFQHDLLQKPNSKLSLGCESILDHHFFTADYIINLAAIIGGIRLFHERAFDLLSHNDRLNANVYELAIRAFKAGNLKKIINVSSSMVFENVESYPSKESDVDSCPPPSSTYGFQKLNTEYYAKGAYEQYGLPYTIIRPFNCVGTGEHDYDTGNSHVLPDLVYKILIEKQNPLKILGSGDQVRCYTHGKDLARGIRLALESEKANQVYNLSIDTPTTVIELAEEIWRQVNPNKPFRFESAEPLKYDVQRRVPDTSKAQRELGFTANISLSETVSEVIEWVKSKR
tara:strand:- start:24715 stop:25719 length:1005 start_codon:yes stop_codon:yes gene_type:complete